MTPQIAPSEAARIAQEERLRRVEAWRKTYAAAPQDARAALLDRALDDEALWFEIETWARRFAGEAEGRAYGWPRTLRAGLESLRTTLDKACQMADAGKVTGQKLHDLWRLRNWLQAHMPISPVGAAATASR